MQEVSAVVMTKWIFFAAPKPKLNKNSFHQLFKQFTYHHKVPFRIPLLFNFLLLVASSGVIRNRKIIRKKDIFATFGKTVPHKKTMDIFATFGKSVPHKNCLRRWWLLRKSHLSKADRRNFQRLFLDWFWRDIIKLFVYLHLSGKLSPTCLWVWSILLHVTNRSPCTSMNKT